jgi:hypothetical protein
LCIALLPCQISFLKIKFPGDKKREYFSTRSKKSPEKWFSLTSRRLLFYIIEVFTRAFFLKKRWHSTSCLILATQHNALHPVLPYTGSGKISHEQILQ